MFGSGSGEGDQERGCQSLIAAYSMVIHFSLSWGFNFLCFQSPTTNYGLNILTLGGLDQEAENHHVDFRKKTARLEIPHLRAHSRPRPFLECLGQRWLDGKGGVWGWSKGIEGGQEWLLPAPALTAITLEGRGWGVELSEHSLHTSLEVQLHI